MTTPGTLTAAGLTIRASQTTPTRPGKAPRCHQPGQEEHAMISRRRSRPTMRKILFAITTQHMPREEWDRFAARAQQESSIGRVLVRLIRDYINRPRTTEGQQPGGQP